MIVLIYIAVIVLANVLTARIGALELFSGFLIIPSGSLFVGATFIARDFVQIKHGKKTAYIAIGLAIAVSAAISLAVGDTVFIAVASAISFFMSEAVDTEIFSRMKKPILQRVLFSGTAGSIVDSSVFVLVGLSPIGGSLLPWEGVLPAIVGQVLSKVLLQFLAVGLFSLVIKE